MIKNITTISCNYCGKQQAMPDYTMGPMAMRHPTPQLPDGWVFIEQGLGHMGGAGTSALPAEVDVVVAGKTYCTAVHAAFGITQDAVESGVPIHEEAEEDYAL